VWISADERRIPVMLNSKIFVGSIYIERIEDKVGPQASAVQQPIRQVRASETGYLEQ